MKSAIIIATFALIFTVSSAAGIGACNSLSIPLATARQSVFDEGEKIFFSRGVVEGKVPNTPLVRDSIDTACTQVLSQQLLFKFTATYHFVDSDGSHPLYVNMDVNYAPRTKDTNLLRYTVSDVQQR